MSIKRLRKTVFTVIAFLVGYSALYAIVEATGLPISEVLATLVPMAVAIPAAWLAGAFARRNSHVQAMRDLWRQLISALQLGIQYTYKTAPTESDYSATLAALSTAIDLVRGLFKNVPTDYGPDLYPFESLKEIHDIVAGLGYGEGFCSISAAESRERIIRRWKNVRDSILAEFDRDVPLEPVSRYLTGEVR